jgi:hypothetical protein
VFCPVSKSRQEGGLTPNQGETANVEKSCEKASVYFTQAAHHHAEAAKHHEAGNHERAAHHNEIAHAHVIDAREQVQEARKAYTKDHGKK